MRTNTEVEFNLQDAENYYILYYEGCTHTYFLIKQKQ